MDPEFKISFYFSDSCELNVLFSNTKGLAFTILYYSHCGIAEISTRQRKIRNLQ